MISSSKNTERYSPRQYRGKRGTLGKNKRGDLAMRNGLHSLKAVSGRHSENKP